MLVIVYHVFFFRFSQCFMPRHLAFVLRKVRGSLQNVCLASELRLEFLANRFLGPKSMRFNYPKMEV